jgi:iron complex outermembrane receptor protein
MLAALLASTAMAGHAFAQQKPAETAAPETQIGEVVVTAKQTTGGGQMVAATGSQVVETISKEYIDSQIPSASPALLISNLPSVNVSNTDAFGLDGGANVQIHGLNSFDLGFVLDGVPVYNSGSGYSNETIDAHDLTTASVAPGTTTLDAPTIGSAAGTFYLTMRDPSLRPGGAVDIGGGTQSYNMQYMRLDSGEIGNTGLRGFASFSRTYADNWRGGGFNEKYHIDFKAVKDWDNGSRIALEGSVNRQIYSFYYFPTQEQYQTENVNSDDFNLHKTYEFFGDTSFYKLNQQTPSYAMVYSLPIHWVINPTFTIDDTPYVWMFFGTGTGGSVLDQGSAYQGTQLANVDLTRGGKIVPTDGQVLVDSAYHEVEYQEGNVFKITGDFGLNKVVAGVWIERFMNYDRDPVSIANQTTGDPPNPWNSSAWYRLANGQPYYDANDDDGYVLTSGFVSDTLSLLDNRLTLSAGTKYVNIAVDLKNYIPGSDPENTTHYNSLLPQAAIKYQVNDHNSVYADIEKDFHLPFIYSILDFYSINSGQPTSAPSDARPEEALKEEVGWRYKGDFLLADVSFFNINLRNHLLTLTELVNGVYESETANAGNQVSRGIDAQFGTKPFHHFSPYISFEYLDSHTGNDIPVLNEDGAQDYLPTNGKYSTQAPKYQASFGLTYANGPFSASARLRWVDSQYASLMNDESMPSYIHDDFSVAYKLPETAVLHNSKIQLNLSNITNSKEPNGVYFTPFNALDTKGTKGGVIASGGSPTYYLEPSFAAVVSLSTSF